MPRRIGGRVAVVFELLTDRGFVFAQFFVEAALESIAAEQHQQPAPEVHGASRITRA